MVWDSRNSYVLVRVLGVPFIFADKTYHSRVFLGFFQINEWGLLFRLPLSCFFRFGSYLYVIRRVPKCRYPFFYTVLWKPHTPARHDVQRIIIKTFKPYVSYVINGYRMSKTNTCRKFTRLKTSVRISSYALKIFFCSIVTRNNDLSPTCLFHTCMVYSRKISRR